MWVDGVGARKEKEREKERRTDRTRDGERVRARDAEVGLETLPLLSLSLSLSLSAHRRQTQAAPVFFTLLFLLLTARREGVRLWGAGRGGGRCWLAAVKMGKEEKGKRGGERTCPQNRVTCYRRFRDLKRRGS